MESIDKIDGTFGKRQTEQKTTVPSAVIRRLPRYHRCLGELLRADKLRISSAELSKIMDVTASQIRQDLNCFGGFGQQGYGYNVKFLYSKISELLGVDEGFNAVIIGAGKLGRALAATHMFERRGVNRLAMFDTDPNVIGTKIYDVPVYSVEELGDFCKTHNVHIGVLTVPKEAAYDVAQVIVDAGVKGIWNFAPIDLEIPEGIALESVHLSDSLHALSFMIKNMNEGKD